MGIKNAVGSILARTYSISRTHTHTHTHTHHTPRLWNSLPADLRQAYITFEQFKRLLKTFLFGCWDRGALWLAVNLRLISSLTYLLTYLLTHYSRYPFFISGIIGVGAQSTLGEGARDFCPKLYAWKINKMPEFYMTFARKIKKIPEFYMIYTRNY